MKRLIFILIFWSISTNSQNIYISGGIDVRNAFQGSNPTNNEPSIDAIIQFGMIGGKTEVVIGYEKFEVICFDKFFFGAGHQFLVNDEITLIPSIQPSLIGRWGENWQTVSSHLSVGVSLAIRYKLSYHLSLELDGNALPRTDLIARYPEIHRNTPVIFSNYCKIVYRI
jgi:hypothetical protein